MVKRKIKSIWNNWKMKVDKHNENCEYIYYEECWNYNTIFYPFIIGLLVVIFFGLLNLLVNGVFPIKFLIKSYFMVLIVSYLMLYVNWKTYD